MTDLSFLPFESKGQAKAFDEKRNREMSDMATLIREENNRLFSPQLDEIKGYIKEYDDGKILASECLGSIAATLGYDG